MEVEKIDYNSMDESEAEEYEADLNFDSKFDFAEKPEFRINVNLDAVRKRNEA